MFKKMVFVAAFGFASFALNASADDGDGNQGTFRCTATGTRNDNHGGQQGISTSGYGDSLEDAQDSALDRCHTLTQGRGCRLTRCVESVGAEAADHSCVVTGLRQHANGAPSGFSVRGYGNSDDSAARDGLSRCRSIGTSCNVSSCD